MTLRADRLKHDPRVLKARELLLEAVADHQSQLHQISPPQKDLEMNYETLIKSFGEERGANLYFPYLGSGFGKGVLVELLDGSIKYDMINGIGTHYWGHLHPQILQSNLEASLSDVVMQGHLQQNDEVAQLTDLLVRSSKLDHCFLSSSGAMANENALKIIFQKRHPATRLLAFEKCFMGRTLSLSQITDKPAFREGLPLNMAIDYIPFYKDEEPEKSTKEAVQILKQYLARYPKQHAAMCFELVQGEGGFYPGARSFFEALMKVLKEHGVTIFVDEVQTFGRTSQLFATEHFGLGDYVDVITIGKLSLVCATLFRNSYKPKPGLLSQTFIASTTAIRGSMTILKGLMDGGYFGEKGKIMQIHQRFKKHFEQLEKKLPGMICGPYGIGGMIAFTPFDGNSQVVAKFVQDLFQAGVISFVAGSNPTRVRFLVPMGAIEFDDVDKVMEIVESVLQKGFSS